MIFTVTLNPAIDHFVRLDRVELGTVNRASSDQKVAGGKGINVSKVLKRLGHPSETMGFIGGFTGRFIKETLEQEGITANFTEIASDTRINIKIQADQETEINGASPRILEEDLKNLITQLERLKAGDQLVLAGSVPETIKDTIYMTLTEEARKRKADVFIDSSGRAFEYAIKAAPTFIKPNHHELAELFETGPLTPKESLPYVKELLKKDIKYVLVSFAGEGAVLGTREGIYFANTPKGELKNSVGAGDSVVAGFLAALSENKSTVDAFKFSVAAGSATAFSEGFCQREDVEELMKEINIINLEEGV
ncbi:1-phosphofructokinase [Bacillus suaedae]|uniref:Tagatose-6-phosphate kinase n=1 Tax=Halalkalibacter suaedae TaxID=2822140 RepID=A0A940WTX9_9BACI|nr:1-phosphofructokinase [Bacillus suaedae]MBP3952415.1 1-phosphofructokinase [Bacillus suaedae]